MMVAMNTNGGSVPAATIKSRRIAYENRALHKLSGQAPQALRTLSHEVAQSIARVCACTALEHKLRA